MNGMSGFYGAQYQVTDPRRSIETYPQPGSLDNTGPDPMMIGEAQTLDEIINQNNQEMMRRRTYHPQYHANGSPGGHMRRASMMEFGSNGNGNGDLADWQFDPNPAQSILSSHLNNVSQSQHRSLDPRRVRSRDKLTLDTRFQQASPAYESMHNVTSYSPALMSGVSMGLDHNTPYLPQSMDLSVDFDPASGEVTPMNMSHQANQPPIFTDSPMAQNLPASFNSPVQDTGGGALGTDEQALMDRVSKMGIPSSLPTASRKPSRSGPSPPNALSASQLHTVVSIASPSNQMSLAKSRRSSAAEQQSQFGNADDLDEKVGENSIPSVDAAPTTTRFTNAYSASGFDMLGVLMRVATRKTPEINIGPVDLSCAFVVCEIAKHDTPIVYCSDVFERLTGYTKFEILGRNCRFLQAPDGKVQAGIKRKYVDDNSVLEIKNKVSRRQEIQISLINYRKGGQPFMNLLTMIPVPWDTDELKFYVGFQVDLVEQPNSVAARNPDGTYAINYRRDQLPRYVLQPPETNSLQGDIGQTIGPDEVSMVLGTIGSGESELSRRIWDKILLENTDDVVHVLSLKGLFLYLSPACRKVLEYDASELVGTALSTVCHPSDIVPVTRELKDTSSGATVNVVFRIRRKHSGYTWFESHGCLHTEQGKGRKCIILVGRERPVYALARSQLVFGGGIGDSEVWSKMSTSGMFLFVSSNVRLLLDRTPEDLIGTSIQPLMRAESRKELGRVLELARIGKISTFKHDLQNRRGQVLQAQTTVYPGDAVEGRKPTFLVAQTRLVKMTRGVLVGPKPNLTVPPRTEQASIGSATPMTNISGNSINPTALQPSSTQHTSQPMTLEGIVTEAGGSGLTLGTQDEALAAEDNIFDELKTTRSTSWQFELRQMEKQNRLLAEELQTLLSRKKKRKRRKGSGQMEKDCANCHTRATPEWRRGPSGNRDLCNSCGLRWAKQNGRVSPRKSSSDHGDKVSNSPMHKSPLHSDQKTTMQMSGGQSGPPTTFPSIMPKMDPALPQSHYGNMPPKIEEVMEPPHHSVLPT